jgi:hypothetical protein
MDVKMASLELDMRAVAPSPSGGAAPVQTVAIAATLAALVSIYLFFLVPYLQAGSGIFDATGHAFGRDFANIWTAGRLGVDGQTHLIYDLRLYHVVQDTYFGVDYPLHAWSYPPAFLPFVLPFGTMSYLTAFALWTVLTGGLLLLAARAWGADGWGLALLALSPAVVINAFGGQNGALSAAILLGALYQLDRRPVLAGILIGCMVYKPHLALLMPVALLAAQRWRVIAVAATTVAALILFSISIYGIEPWITYITETAPLHAKVLQKGEGAIPLMMPGAYMAARVLGLLDYAPYIQAAFSAIAVAAVAWAWRRPDEPILRAAIFLAAVPLAVPYAFNYDLTVTTAAAMLAVIRFRGRVGWPLAVSGLAVCTLPALVLIVNTLELPLGPVIFTGFLAALLAALNAIPRAAAHPRRAAVLQTP